MKVVPSHVMIGTDVDRLGQYRICARGKMTATPFEKGNSPCNELLKIVHSDVVGPMRVESMGATKYFVTFIDDGAKLVF